MFGDISIIGFFMASPTMIVLAVCSVVTLGFAIERALYFWSSSSSSQVFMNELAAQLKSGGQRGALEYCKRAGSPVGRVMAQGVMHMGRTRDELQQRLDTAIDLETVEMERNLGVLGTMSNIAPLLGLFGTVVGIIRAFADIARTGSGGGSVVAMGVSEALMTTAAGIVVAVIATVAFNFFVRRIRTRTAHLEDARESFFTLWSQAHRAARQAESAPIAAPGAARAPGSQQITRQVDEALAEVMS